MFHALDELANRALAKLRVAVLTNALRMRRFTSSREASARFVAVTRVSFYPREFSALFNNVDHHTARKFQADFGARRSAVRHNLNCLLCLFQKAMRPERLQGKPGQSCINGL